MILFRRIGMLACVMGVMGLVWTAAPRQAEAKLLELQLRVHGGGLAGIYGTGDYDPANSTDAAEAADEDFFKTRRGASFGAILNVEVLFVDLTYEFYQLANENGLGSTLNNFLMGFDWDFKASEKWVITPYLLAGFGLATQNNSWLEKEGYPQIALADLQSRMAMARLGLQIEVKLGRFFRFGLDVGFGYHYGINTVSTPANDYNGHSHGFHITGNLSFAFVWNVFEKKKKKKEPPKVIIISPAGVGTAPGPAPAPAPAPGLRAAPGTRPAPGTQPKPAPTPAPRTTPPRTTPDRPTTPPSRPTEAPPRTKKRKVAEPPPAR